MRPHLLQIVRLLESLTLHTLQQARGLHFDLLLGGMRREWKKAVGDIPIKSERKMPPETPTLNGLVATLFVVTAFHSPDAAQRQARCLALGGLLWRGGDAPLFQAVATTIFGVLEAHARSFVRPLVVGDKTSLPSDILL